MTESLKQDYLSIKSRIEKRINEFRRIKKSASNEELFEELVFCLLTPQTKSTMAGRAVEILKEKNLILEGAWEEISRELNIVRFRNNKAKYIVRARGQFYENGQWVLRAKLESFQDMALLREWLVKNIKGFGYKEASHFLRNTGFGLNLAILDRHILRNMVKMGLIPKIPDNLTAQIYLEIEKKLQEFSNQIQIPFDHLDFLWFYQQTGEIFK